MTVTRQSAAALVAAAILTTAPQSRSQAVVPTTLQNAPAACIAAPPGPGFPSYLDDSFSQLKAAVPALRNLKFEAHPPTAQHEDESDAILQQTGAIITAMLPRVPNLIAKEELSQTTVALPYSVNEMLQAPTGSGTRRNSQPVYNSASRGLEGEELHKALLTIVNSARRVTFSYRIHAEPDPTYGTVLNESRTDVKNQAVGFSVASSDGPHSIGFGSAWLMFMPHEQQELRFRYLGEQKIGSRNTYVLAFAQLPERVPLPSQIVMQDFTCPYLMQGVVWIDQSIFQIVSLQTDLLSPLPGIYLKRLRSELHFSEIHIPERNLTLWMPSDLEISTETSGTATAELHRYSNYRIFGATSRIILPDPE